MEIEKILDKIRDLIVGEMKEEFKIFRESVRGELAGFRLAIESMDRRVSSMGDEIREIRKSMGVLTQRIDETNKRIDETNKRIDDTNKRIDELRAELKAEIMQNTARIDEINKRIDETNKRIDDTNKRIDALYIETSKIREDLNKALSERRVIDDILTRIQRMEEKVFA